MRKRSARWKLESMKRPCQCGSLAQHALNAGNFERHVFKHRTPSGELCPFWALAREMERALATAR